MRGKCWGEKGNCSWCDVEIMEGCAVGLSGDHSAVREHESGCSVGNHYADHKVLSAKPRKSDVETGRTYGGSGAGKVVDAITSICPNFNWDGILLLSGKGHAVHVRRQRKGIHVRRTRLVSVSDN